MSRDKEEIKDPSLQTFTEVLVEEKVAEKKKEERAARLKAARARGVEVF